MKLFGARCAAVVLTAALVWTTTAAAAEKPRFTATLTAEQRAALGLAQATAEQLAALDAAVEAYQQSQHASIAQAAATQAVAEYRATQEPKVVAAALARVPESPKTDEPSRFTATLVGRFEGWSGSTVFTLDNGQVWKQAAQDTYYPKTRENVAVVIYKSPNGHWRLRVLDDQGAWVTVKRVK